MIPYKKLLFIISVIALLFVARESQAGFWKKKATSQQAAATSSPSYPAFEHIKGLQRLSARIPMPASDSTHVSKDGKNSNLPAVFSLVSALLPIAGIIVGAALGGPWGAALFFVITVIPGSILAVVLGIIGLKRKKHRGMAVAGLTIGGIFLLIGLLAFIPALILAL